MLRDIDLALLRETQERALPETCDRIRVVYGDDGIGGRTEVGTSILLGIPCRRTVASWPRDILRSGGVAIRVTKIVTLPHGTDVEEADRLEIGGSAYEVVGFLSVGAWETALRCGCVEVR